MSHYDLKSIPDAKFESGSFSSFGDMTSQIFPWKKGTSHQILVFLPPENGFNLKKMSFDVQNRSSRPKIDPPPLCQFQQFPNRANFFHFVIFGMPQ